ncbi:MAG: ATPase [Rhodobacteraceae bacterium]|nr:ATPase [Paracoccaceae bacterium]
MSEWKQKRFWSDSAVVEDAGGFGIALDGHRVKTPAKAMLVLPSHEMAVAVAAEWAAQGEVVNPLTMPFTRSANSAIDKVRIQHAEVADLLADYGDSDLLCYRADGPKELVARQAEAWDPMLDWAASVLGVRLTVVTGIMHQPQSPEAVHLLRRRVHEMSEFQLAAFHDLVSLSGSLILGFAVTEEKAAPDAIWTLSRLDELWQEEHWGEDEEATARAAHKRAAFLHVERFFRVS